MSNYTGCIGNVQHGNYYQKKIPRESMSTLNQHQFLRNLQNRVAAKRCTVLQEHIKGRHFLKLRTQKFCCTLFFSLIEHSRYIK